MKWLHCDIQSTGCNLKRNVFRFIFHFISGVSLDRFFFCVYLFCFVFIVRVGVSFFFVVRRSNVYVIECLGTLEGAPDERERVV